MLGPAGRGHRRGPERPGEQRGNLGEVSGVEPVVPGDPEPEGEAPMRTPLRAMIALTISLAVLFVAAAASAGSGDAAPPPRAAAGHEGSRGSLGSGGGSMPGFDGTGTAPAPDGGSNVGGDPAEPCGKAVTHGTGPDATVSYTPCPGDEPPSEPQPQGVEPTPGMADVHARGFDTARIGDDDRTVTIDFVSGIEPCYVLDHVGVVYGADTVTITLYEGHQPTDEDVACIDIGVFKRVIVTLDEPLAGRTIVDGGATG